MPDNKTPPVASRRHGESTAGESGFHRQYTTVDAGSQADHRAIFVGGRCVGQVADGVFVKHVRGSAHQLRRPPAWCLDVGSLDEAEGAGATAVEIHDTESGVTYRAPIALIREKGFAFDRGFGRQIGLPLGLWHVRRPGEPNARQLAFVLEGVGL